MKFIKVCYSKRHLVCNHRQWFATGTKPNFGRVARELKRALSARRLFIMAQNIGPAKSVVEGLLQFR